MNCELRFLLSFTRRLPRIKGAGVFANALKKVYLRKDREEVQANVLGFKMRLDPAECVDGGLLFYPQLYDHHEIAFLKEGLGPGDVFLDVGAHIGLYTLVCSKIVGNRGTILSIEADPDNYEKLCIHLRINDIRNVKAINVGVSDKKQTLRLGINTTGNRGGSSFLSEGKEGIYVPCTTLLDILVENKIQKIAGAKFDIEGFEYRVLDAFLENAKFSLLPRFIITEFHPGWVNKSGGNTVELLSKKGYRVYSSHHQNYIMMLT